jgi:hypothetical protein
MSAKGPASFPLHCHRALRIGTSVAAAIIMAAIITSAAAGQTTYPSAQIAAAQYALTHGLVVPESTVVVAERDVIKFMHGTAMRSKAAALADAEAIARLIGATGSVAKAGNVLECTWNYCATKTQRAVLAISEAEPTSKGGFGLLLILHMPSPTGNRATRTVRQMSLQVVKKGSGFIGDSIQIDHTGPTRVPPRDR